MEIYASYADLTLLYFSYQEKMKFINLMAYLVIVDCTLASGCASLLDPETLLVFPPTYASLLIYIFSPMVSGWGGSYSITRWNWNNWNCSTSISNKYTSISSRPTISSYFKCSGIKYSQKWMCNFLPLALLSLFHCICNVSFE